jgi:hypothetical protein
MHLLWCKRSLPKWHCQALHPRSLRERTQAIAAHSRSLAAGSSLCTVAILPVQRRTPPQLSASAGGRHIEARAFQLNCVGCNMKHVHTFGCPVFALQNTLASGNQLPRWSPPARLGLNLGRSPMHARNVYLVLNLITGCVSPQYHCCCDDFFVTTCHGGPDVSGTIC